LKKFHGLLESKNAKLIEEKETNQMEEEGAKKKAIITR